MNEILKLLSQARDRALYDWLHAKNNIERKAAATRDNNIKKEEEKIKASGYA